MATGTKGLSGKAITEGILACAAWECLLWFLRFIVSHSSSTWSASLLTLVPAFALTIFFIVLYAYYVDEIWWWSEQHVLLTRLINFGISLAAIIAVILLAVMVIGYFVPAN